MLYIPFPLPISTADAERIELHYVGDELLLRFVDWQQRQVQLRFTEVVRFAWDPLGGQGAPRDDTAYEVLESPLLHDLETHGQLGATSHARHFQLCFNAASVLDLVAASVSAA